MKKQKNRSTVTPEVSDADKTAPDEPPVVAQTIKNKSIYSGESKGSDEGAILSGFHG